MNNIKERAQAITEAALHPSPATLGVLGIMALATALGLLSMGHKILGMDESISVGIARADWPAMWQVITQSEVNMSFYHVLLHFWVRLGDSEFFISSLSLIFSVLTIPAVYALGSRLFSRRAGLLAALLMAVNYFFIQFSEEARGYSLLLLLVTVSSLLLVTGQRRSSKWVWAGFAVTSSLAMYTHVFAAFVLAAQAISLIFLRRREIPWKGLLISWALIILFIFPLLYYYFTANPSNLDWAKQPGPGYIYGAFLALTGGSNIALAAYFIPCLIALIYAIKQWLITRASYETWRYALLLAWLLAPIAAAFVISQFKPIFSSRYFIICLSPLVLLAAAGSWQLRRWLPWVLIIALLGISGYQIYHPPTSDEETDWPKAVAYVLSMAEENDAIVFYEPTTTTEFDYYRSRSSITTELPTEEPYFDPEVYDTMPVLHLPEGYSAGGRLPQPDGNLAGRLSKYDRIWLFLHWYDDPYLGRDAQYQMIRDTIEENYGTPAEKEFSDSILILLYTVGQPSTP